MLASHFYIQEVLSRLIQSIGPPALYLGLLYEYEHSTYNYISEQIKSVVIINRYYFISKCILSCIVVFCLYNM